MKILQISNDYYNSCVYRTLQETLLQKGADSYFFVPMQFGNRVHEDRNVICSQCYRKWDRIAYFSKQRKIYKELSSEIEALHPDLLHAHFAFSGGYSCLKAKQDYNIPYIVSVQDTDVNLFFKYLKPLGEQILAEADKIIFISNAYKKWITENVVSKRYRALISAKSVIIPFAVNQFWMENRVSDKRTFDGNELKIITVGDVSKRKNQIATAQAVAILRERNINASLKIVGAAKNQRIDRKVRRYDFVRRIPKIDKEVLISEYRNSDIFVLPSLTESFGLVYAEALSQGLPIVYSQGQGFDEQFEEGFVGYHVKARDPNSIADGIMKVIGNYDAIAENCQNASNKFAPWNVVDQLIWAYETVSNGQEHMKS